MTSKQELFNLSGPDKIVLKPILDAGAKLLNEKIVVSCDCL